MSSSWSKVSFTLTVLVAPAVCSCSDISAPSRARLIPALDRFDYRVVTPAASYDLWELRQTFGDGRPGLVIGGGGEKTRAEIDPDVLATFDSASVQLGFGPGCPPGACSYFLVSMLDGEVETWATTERGTSFLGSIDSGEEAALVALAHGYHWGQDRETAAVWSVPDGYELLVRRLVAFCAPVQVDRFHLRVSKSGQLSVLDSEVWEREDEACI